MKTIKGRKERVGTAPFFLCAKLNDNELLSVGW